MSNREEWRDIPGYEGLYQASDHGRIRSLNNIQHVVFRGKPVIKPKYGKVIKPGKHRGGYAMVWLSKNGVVKAHTVHRLVADTFLPNPSGLPEINHIDGDKKNNSISNLEWCTRNTNIQHMYQTLNKGRNGRAVVCCETGKVFRSIVDAAASIGRSHGSVSQALRTGQRSGGFHWKWV